MMENNKNKMLLVQHEIRMDEIRSRFIECVNSSNSWRVKDELEDIIHKLIDEINKIKEDFS